VQNRSEGDKPNTQIKGLSPSNLFLTDVKASMVTGEATQRQGMLSQIFSAPYGTYETH
jgi:hypothetical protein